MITVHHLENSRSQRVLWLLEELELDYEIRHYKRDPATMLAPPELRAVHPLGKAPVITDGDFTIAESGAIIEYLINRYDNGHLKPPPGSQAHLDYRYWLHYAEGSLMPLLVMKLVFSRIPKSPMPFFIKPVAKGIAGKVLSTFLQPQLEQHLAFIEQHLQQHAWFAGDKLSGADIQMSFPVEAALARVGDSSRYRAMEAFREKVRTRPAYRQALEKGGPLNILS